ncbi:hypothetical protein Leryth_026681 [Lithospermum erythrorhizon]|uniref:Protein kinase domain-containing protein n=1 Tax=Lithospermum erythrorhizon TaxID=34254 RepID=A0AAV3REZ4_LITER|nr:hypothetical protein Leryth_026681 [Lithospermum erythrorhizon]
MNWVRGAKIGHGSFGTVNLAIPTNQNCSKLMAVKSCGLAHSASLINEKLVLDELKACQEVISCLGDCYSFENGEKLYNVLLDFAPGGNLAEKINNSKGNPLSEFEVRRYTKAILRGLMFIHKNGYVHCDIKPQNILLGQNGDIKIADFGLAKRNDLREKSGLRCDLSGTPIYMSPEMVIRGEQGCPSDVWALGCVVLEMLTGSPTWRCADVAALLMKIGVGEEGPQIPTSLSDQGKDFLEKCFAKDPRERWTAEMLLNHSYVFNLDDCQCGTTVSLKDSNIHPSVSPRCPFDFPNCLSESNSSTPTKVSELDNYFGTSYSSAKAAERLKGLVCNQRADWSVEDDWVAVR